MTAFPSTTPHAMEAPLRFPEHEAFLRFVHSAPGGGDELYLGRALPGAIERYVKFWLPLVSHSIGSEGRARTSHPASRYRVGVASSPARAAPIRHVLHGAIRAGPRSRDGGVPGADCLGRRRRDSAFVATAFRRRAILPAKSATRHHTEWGARDPLSNQTTLCAEVKDKCAAVRTDLRFDYDVEACSARQRTFLWQVSRPACRDVNSATCSVPAISRPHEETRLPRTLLRAIVRHRFRVAHAHARRARPATSARARCSPACPAASTTTIP